MSTVGSAEGTPNSSSGNTNVTVYHCKDCKLSPCSFEKFDKIAETHKTFLDVVTNETHVTVCFEQANSYVEGIYGIFWKRAGGAGISCGILNSGGMLCWEPGY